MKFGECRSSPALGSRKSQRRSDLKRHIVEWFDSALNFSRADKTFNDRRISSEQTLRQGAQDRT